jgi:energy-coupling factor transporter ATP-binding protein EcfA2
MRIKRFRGRGIHGYLTFDLRFNEELNFLTGINGSGKTSVLAAIVSLITPDFSRLAGLVYDSISVQLEHDGSNFTIEATNTDERISLSASSVDGVFEFRRYIPDLELLRSRQLEREAEHFSELSISAANNNVVQKIASLPTPMFLGLDRRPGFASDERSQRAPPPSRIARVGRNVFSGSLANSVYEATALAENKYRDALIAAGTLSERLQREMLLSLLTFAPEDFGQLSIPSAAEIDQLQQIRSNVGDLANIFRLPSAEVQRRMVPFLDLLRRSARDIPSGQTIDSIISGKESQATLRALMSWSSNRGQIGKIRAISESISRYNTEQTSILAPTKKYLGLVNEFLGDSGKTLEFNERGYIHVDIKDLDQKRDVSCLSSGEAQIFIILTQLAFNPLAQEANVFLVDEPELSLHVRWQELFVSSVRTANPNIQYIMATHSPSIILDKLRYCIDLSNSKRRRRRD